jgi:predicted component of type VI protein secretion system
VGTIRTPGNLAYDLRFASSEPGEDGGTRIFLATDRPVSYWEAVNRPRLSDYPFTFIELRLNGDGGGVGKLSLATKVIVSKDGKSVELENYDAQPIALNEVRRKGR